MQPLDYKYLLHDPVVPVLSGTQSLKVNPSLFGLDRGDWLAGSCCLRVCALSLALAGWLAAHLPSSPILASRFIVHKAPAHTYPRYLHTVTFRQLLGIKH